MKKQTLLLPRQDETVPIYLTIWQPDGPARAIVQLCHGMAEHMERYEPLALALCRAGYIVAGSNHRGHGREWPRERLGHFADKDGWDKLVLDLHTVMTRMKNDCPGLPYVLLGHSMGSFAAREFALRYGRELQGLVLSGTGHYPLALCAAGACLAALFPKRKISPFLHSMVFAGNNAAFEPVRTPHDWLTRDTRQVDLYRADDKCGFPFTGASYRAFFQGLKKLARESRLVQMPKDLPVYFVSGAMDPVGQMEKGVQKVARSFRDAGLLHVTVRIYPGARHECFNEINREEVFAHLIAWLGSTLTSV